MEDALSLGGDEDAFVLSGQKVPHASSVEAGMPMASHVFAKLDGVDTSSLPLLPEGPDGGLDAGESFLEGFERQQVLDTVSDDPMMRQGQPRMKNR